VKTKSLTTWSRLFSSELKYNITVDESRQKFVKCYVFYTVLLSIVLGGYFLLLPLFIITLSIIALLILISLFIRLIDKTIFKAIKHYLYGGNHASNKDNFIIGNEGKCILAEHQTFQLDVHSRVGWFGCWLVLTSTSSVAVSHEKVVRHLFLFKNSVSLQDYSRISRIIKRLKHSAKNSQPTSI
jgi:hypothetical protein